MCKRKWIPSLLVTLAVGTLTAALACGGGEGETVVVKEEVIREVPVERIVEKEVIREVIKEVPVEKTVVEQVMIEVAPSLLADNQDLRIAQISNPVGLHYSETTIESESVIQLLYDPYFLFNEETAQFEGWLATEWEFTDPTTFVMSVRDDVSFHDGEKFTMPAAIEVVRWLREDSDLDRYANLNFGGFETWEAVGDYTIELGRDSPNSNPLSGFTRGRFKPMSATQLAKLGWEAYSDDPVGMGPMQYVDWERENFVRLEKFQDYWAFDTAIETMSFHQVPETAVRVAGLQTGDFNIAYAVPVELIPRLLNDDFKIFTNRVQQTSTIYLNPRGTDPEMADKRVRQAMQYAVDLETIHGTILGGYALPVPAGQMGPAGTFGFNPTVKAYPYDPDKARALLAEAGFPDGFSVQGINTETLTWRLREVLTAMQAYWADVGVEVDIVWKDLSPWLTDLRAGQLGAVNEIGMNWYGLFPITISRVNHPDWTDRMTKIREETDQVELEALLLEAAEYMYDQAWSLFAFQIPLVQALHPSVDSLKWGPTYEMKLENARVLDR